MKKLTMMASAIIAVSTTLAVNVPDFDTLISHRGESIDAPENTMPAFKTAVDRGFGFECDVYLSKDGRVFTFHDRNLSRTTGGANKKACNQVTWDEVSKLDVGNWGKWKDSKFAGTRPALLEEVLTLARDGRQIYVEIKTGPEIVPFIKKVFASQKNATPKNTLFISFNSETCRVVKRHMPEYKVYWLVAATVKKNGKNIPVTAEEVIAQLKDLGVDGVDILFKSNIVTADFVRKVKAAGYECHVWTVDDIFAAVEAFRRGVDTVTTNCALELRNRFNHVYELGKARDASLKK